MKDSISITDAEGNEEPFFSLKFLVMKYLKMSDADLELNEKMKLEEKLAKAEGGSQEAESGNETEMEDTGEDTGGEETEGGGDIDDEMMGEVQPESSETTQI